ncbi:hypothetical protein CONCODRAFT_9012 [Conidiobolus coronatus NRRL 28638]|uniref:Uncharacterized protein n=1 Tax=Conidiobolus coronatus (strain ATCC 28846 / CBS 209.66 / NRRL 28638) TaxID=796925 RepID=A0A137P0U0_CONC2|nr:hypothetical protein CONCODRAFT_9012 [Conidiobolus coronatus NRRL 28638]|eukprot:KXN68683.1 hypothetical protein CONCODRAFT_9012 [Conidiobolus coronatus NRRL 28638]
MPSIWSNLPTKAKEARKPSVEKLLFELQDSAKFIWTDTSNTTTIVKINNREIEAIVDGGCCGLIISNNIAQKTAQKTKQQTLATLVKHNINAEGKDPIACRPYRKCYKDLIKERELIDEMLNNKVIRPSNSPCAFPETKYALFRSSIQFLDYIISEKGKHTDPALTNKLLDTIA